MMKQSWLHLLFAHWSVAPEKLAPLIPKPLQLDLHEGRAWIGVVPFHMDNVRLSYSPPIPTVSRFAELNVRTYVTLHDRPGVYFFSLDATSLLTVTSARMFYHLPYYHAEITMTRDGQTVEYRSKRRNAGGQFQFQGSYRPIGEGYRAVPGTLDYWLTERYCFYTVRQNQVYRCDIVHEPWLLHPAEANIRVNTMANINGFVLPDEQPLLHYSERLDVTAGVVKKINGLK
jgi:hypothetical protein